MLYARQFAIESVIARCFAFVGPHLPLDGKFALGNFIRDAGGPIRIAGDGTPFRSYLYAADLAVWLWTLLMRGANSQAYNVGAQAGLSIAAAAQAVSECFTPPPPVRIALAPDPALPPSRYVPLRPATSRPPAWPAWPALNSGCAKPSTCPRRSAARCAGTSHVRAAEITLVRRCRKSYSSRAIMNLADSPCTLNHCSNIDGGMMQIARTSAADLFPESPHGPNGMPDHDPSPRRYMDPRDIRLIILEQSKRAHVGHIGSALSVADIIAALYGEVLRISAPDDPDRDRFILSKGHAALALYAALALRGLMPPDQLNTYCADGTLLGVHPEHDLPGVDFCSGSLGQGLSYGAGAALAARMQGSKRRVYVLLSDAECNEGSVWEAAMFAAHRQLGNLTAIIDLNGQQALGHTKDVCHTPNMAERWRAFGWDTTDIDGHDVGALTNQMTNYQGDRPQMLVAHTVFGHGVSFMQNQIKWHYLPMTDDQFHQARGEVRNAITNRLGS